MFHDLLKTLRQCFSSCEVSGGENNRSVCLLFLKLFYVLKDKENKKNMFDFQCVFVLKKRIEHKKQKIQRTSRVFKEHQNDVYVFSNTGTKKAHKFLFFIFLIFI